MAVEGAKPFWQRYRWLIARRTCQSSVLALFLIGPYGGLWAVKGTLASSTVLDTLSLSDPFIALQSLAAGHSLASTALTGALIVAAFYMLFGGRTFCSWVCPINPVTDAASWLRRTAKIRSGFSLPKATRFWLVPALLALSWALGHIAFEAVNPITMLHRGLLFGLGLGWVIVALVFVFDLLAVKHGWCGHICPVGAFYGLLGRMSVFKVSAGGRADCTDCGDCFQVCPEPQVIAPALYPKEASATPLILDTDCTSCGKCMDVCAPDVFRFAHRFDTALSQRMPR